MSGASVPNGHDDKDRTYIQFDKCAVPIETMTHHPKVLVLLLAIAGASAPAVAQSVPVRVWHWAGHHKEVLLADGLVVGGWSADAAWSTRCQHEFPSACIEGNSLLGPHPGAGKLWGYSIGFAGALVAANHVTYRYLPNPYKHAFWAWSGWVGIGEAFNVNNGVNYLEGLEGLPPPQTFTCPVTEGSSGPVLCLLSGNRSTARVRFPVFAPSIAARAPVEFRAAISPSVSLHPLPALHQ